MKHSEPADWLDNGEKAYLADQMNKVSRSFAVAAPQVESPLHEYLSIAYLVCRVVDNIEDCRQPYDWKKARFDELSRLLARPEQAPATLDGWQAIDWPGLTEHEWRLMSSDSGRLLWQIYGRIPDRYRRTIHHWVEVMAAGMASSQNPDEQQLFTRQRGIRLPRRVADYDQYCYYVAGTVGRMITELALAFYDIAGDVHQRLLANSEACGRALQKTNIVKDFARDLKRGICYLPDEWLREVDYAPFALSGVPRWWIKKVIDNVLAELALAVNYIVELPETAAGYRRAGLLMMLPAYQTLLLAAQEQARLFTSSHQVKISRLTMAQCLLQARKLVLDNAAIHDYAQQITGRIDALLAGAVPAPTPTR